MKKLILCIATIIISSQLSAQIDGFSLGPKVGATFSKYTLDIDDIKEEAKSTFHWGVFARIGQGVYVQPEILFMDRSGVLVNQNRPASEQVIKLKTIDIPVLLGVRLINLDVANVRIFGGPVASLALDRKLTTSNWDEAITENDMRKANWGIQFGAGADVLMFTVDLRYEIGMGDYSKIDLYDLKNRLFTVSLGWKILQ